MIKNKRGQKDSLLFFIILQAHLKLSIYYLSQEVTLLHQHTNIYRQISKEESNDESQQDIKHRIGLHQSILLERLQVKASIGTQKERAMIHIDIQGLRSYDVQPMLQLVFLVLSFGKEISDDKDGTSRTHNSFRQKTKRMVVEMYIQ